MNNFLEKISPLFIFFGIFFILYALINGVCKADERIRFYDTSDGWSKPTWSYADKQWDESWRVYDSKGRFQGRVTKDRLFNRNGRVEEKYYLFTK